MSDFTEAEMVEVNRRTNAFIDAEAARRQVNAPLGLTGEGLNEIIDAEMRRPYAFPHLAPTQVRVSCEIEVNGSKVTYHQLVDALLWEDPAAQERVIRHVREAAAFEVIKKYPPKITIHTQ